MVRGALEWIGFVQPGDMELIQQPGDFRHQLLRPQYHSSDYRRFVASGRAGFHRGTGNGYGMGDSP